MARDFSRTLPIGASRSTGLTRKNKKRKEKKRTRILFFFIFHDENRRATGHNQSPCIFAWKTSSQWGDETQTKRVTREQSFIYFCGVRNVSVSFLVLACQKVIYEHQSMNAIVLNTCGTCRDLIMIILLMINIKI